MAQVQGKGTTLSVGGAVAEVISITGPSMSAGVVETKTLDAEWVLRYPTVKDGGTVAFEIYFSQATHSSLVSALGTLVSACVVTFADDATATFDAVVTKLEIVPGTIDDMLQGSVELAISGEVEIEADSP